MHSIWKKTGSYSDIYKLLALCTLQLREGKEMKSETSVNKILDWYTCSKRKEPSVNFTPAIGPSPDCTASYKASTQCACTVALTETRAKLAPFGSDFRLHHCPCTYVRPASCIRTTCKVPRAVKLRAPNMYSGSDFTERDYAWCAMYTRESCMHDACTTVQHCLQVMFFCLSPLICGFTVKYQ